MRSGVPGSRGDSSFVDGAVDPGQRGLAGIHVKEKSLQEGTMKTPQEMREEAERCIRLARQTIDDSVASALLAYACELEQRAHLLEEGAAKNRSAGHGGHVRQRATPAPAAG
jgi:hypothetical protein